MKQKAEALEAELKTVTKQNEEQSLTGRITAQVSSLLTAAGVKLMPSTASQAQGADGGGGGAAAAASKLFLPRFRLLA